MMKKIDKIKKVFFVICILWGIIIFIYGESWKEKSIVKNRIKKEEVKIGYDKKIAEKSKYCLTPYSYPDSI